MEEQDNPHDHPMLSEPTPPVPIPINEQPVNGQNLATNPPEVPMSPQMTPAEEEKTPSFTQLINAMEIELLDKLLKKTNNQQPDKQNKEEYK